jgi:NAD-dependent dihydropyrimidine dehydrogenase PreA subunit
MKKLPTLMNLLGEHLQLAFSLRGMQIHFDATKCKGLWQCYEVCPVGCWLPDKSCCVVELHHLEKCIACGACVLQCPEGALELR